MKLMSVASLFGVTIVAAIVVASPATASLTHEQFVDRCRPQMQVYVQEALADPPGSEDNPELIAEHRRDTASLRSNGVNDPELRQVLDKVRGELAKMDKAKLRQAASEMKKEMKGITDARGQGGDAAFVLVAICMVDSIVADREGRLAAAASPPKPVQAVPPPLRPTPTIEAHNPAAEASDCLEIIFHKDFAARGVKSNMEAAFLNKCAFRVATIWCIGEQHCSEFGFDNLGAVEAKDYRPVAYAETGKVMVRWAGCRDGFAYRPEFKKTLNYACK